MNKNNEPALFTLRDYLDPNVKRLMEAAQRMKEKKALAEEQSPPTVEVSAAPLWPSPDGTATAPPPTPPKQVPGSYDPNTQRIWKGKVYPKDFNPSEHYRYLRGESDHERMYREILEQNFPRTAPSQAEVHKKALLAKPHAQSLHHDDPLECLRRICTVAIHSTPDVAQSKAFASIVFTAFKFDLLYPNHQEDWHARFNQVFDQVLRNPEGVMTVGDVTLHAFLLSKGGYLLKLLTVKVLEAYRDTGRTYRAMSFRGLAADGTIRDEMASHAIDERSFEEETKQLWYKSLLQRSPDLPGKKNKVNTFKFIGGKIPGTLVMKRKLIGNVTLMVRRLRNDA